MGERRRRRAAGWVAAASVAAVAAAVAVERAYVRRDRARSDRHRDEPYGSVRGKPIGPVASFDGTLLNVEEVGSGPTVVLSHGFSLSIPMWHHQILDLAPEMRLVLHEHRGHGRSGLPPSGDWSLEALARDLDAVVRDAGGDRVVLVGHSMGGMAVMKYCELHPEEIGTRVAGLVLADTTSADVMGGVLGGAGRRIDAAFQGFQAVAMRALAGRADHVDRLRKWSRDLSYLGTRVMGFGPSPSPAQVDFVERMLSETPTEVWLGLIPTISGMDIREALPAIDVPVLVIVGAHDRLTPIDAARRIAEAIPSAELAVLADAGHMPMLERPDAFADLLRHFLARVARPATAR